jgi:hypothetical protein
MWIKLKKRFMNTKFLLMFLGSIPFWGSGLCLLNHQKTIVNLSLIDQILPSYSLLIFVFMAGSYWGISLRNDDLNLQLASNGLTLIAWFGYLLFDRSVFVNMMSALFLFLLVVDYYLYKYRQIEKKYFGDRTIITTVVVVSIQVIYHFLT